jgi:hypothetical protein
MTRVGKLILLIVAAATAVPATTYVWNGPTTPAGVPCDYNLPGCVPGGLPYVVFGIQITTPSGSNPNFVMTIEMNYPVNMQGNTIPPVQWPEDLQLYSTGDVLIHSNNTDYAIVLAPHLKAGTLVDSYQAANLYQAPNATPDFVPSGTNTTIPGAIGILPNSPRPDFPIWVAPGGTQLGTGSLTIAAGGNGTSAEWTITDQFSAPLDFLSNGPVDLSFSSWVCANGLIVGPGGGATGGGGSEVPEPAPLFCVATAFLVGLAFARSRRNRTLQSTL